MNGSLSEVILVQEIEPQTPQPLAEVAAITNWSS